MGLLDSLKGLNINAQRFRMNLVINAARSVAQKEFWPLLDQVGEKRFRALIEAGQPFLSEIPYQQMPEKWRGWIAAAPQYKTMITGLDENILLSLLPDWVQVLVTRDQKSWAWFANECSWINKLFDVDPPQPAPQPPPPRYIPVK